MSDLSVWGPYADRVNPTQIRAFDSPTRYKCFAGRVRAGKTIWMCASMYYLNMVIPRNLTLMGRWVQKDLWTSTVQTWFELFPSEIYRHLTYTPNEAEPEKVYFPNGSIMHFVPLSNRDKWPGMPLGAFAIDQLEQCTSKETFTDLMRRLCRPDVPEEMMFGLATANYEKCWPIFREFFKYKRGIDRVALPDGRSVADLFELFEPEQDENKANIRSEFFAEQMATLSPFERMRLIEGIDLENVGMVFPEWNEDRHVAEFTMDELKATGPLRYILSYDYGMKHHSAFHFGVVTMDQRIHIIGEWGAPGMRVADHEIELVQMAQELDFPLERTMFYAGWDIFETRSQETIASEWSHSFRWSMANRSRLKRREAMKRVLADMTDGHPGLRVHKRCERLRHQMPRLFFSEKEGQEEKFQSGAEDDYYDSAAMLVTSALTPHKEKPVETSLLTGANWKKMAKKRGEGYSVPQKESGRSSWLSGQRKAQG